jgi:hypothetical protein
MAAHGLPVIAVAVITGFAIVTGNPMPSWAMRIEDLPLNAITIKCGPKIVKAYLTCFTTELAKLSQSDRDKVNDLLKDTGLEMGAISHGCWWFEKEKAETCMLRAMAFASKAVRDRWSATVSEKAAEKERVDTIMRLGHSSGLERIDALNSLCAKGKGEPQIGMTEREVISTSWCLPVKTNDTITARRKSSQWVYEGWRMENGHKGYLYFEDGELVTIQTR